MKRSKSNKQIHVGDKVKLLECSDYLAQKSNPKIGSIYECSGVIVDYEKSGRTREVSVQWDNDEFNTYFIDDLEIRNDEFISIWDSPELEDPIE